MPQFCVNDSKQIEQANEAMLFIFINLDLLFSLILFFLEWSTLFSYQEQCQSSLRLHKYWIEFWCLKSSEHDNLKIKRENFEHKIDFCSFFTYLNIKILDTRPHNLFYLSHLYRKNLILFLLCDFSSHDLSNVHLTPHEISSGVFSNVP